MSKQAVELLKHILDECKFVHQAVSGKSFDDFIKDETLKRAVVRSLEIVGEATKKIPADEKLKMPNIEWKNMAGMRDRLIHDYFGVNYRIVWDVAINKLPVLESQIELAIRTSGSH